MGAGTAFAANSADEYTVVAVTVTFSPISKSKSGFDDAKPVTVTETPVSPFLSEATETVTDSKSAGDKKLV